MFEGFRTESVDVGDVELHVRHGGSGPAALLLHGHPRTGATWHRVAARLLDAGLTVLVPDLRGYGRSSKPVTTADHAPYSKRTMAADLPRLMAHLGHEALERCDERFARLWWHWFFFAQPETPERVINADPDAWYRASPEAMGEDAYAEFRAATRDPQTVHAMLEDYRAGLGVDREHDRRDREDGRRIDCPLLVLWSTRDDMELLYGDPLEVWRAWSTDLRGHGIESGHHMAEEAPDDLAGALLRHFTAS